MIGSTLNVFDCINKTTNEIDIVLILTRSVP
jgi:hypothetical protein